mgnify:CR=1 FL=1
MVRTISTLIILFIGTLMGQSLPGIIPNWADSGVMSINLADTSGVKQILGSPMDNLIEPDDEFPYVCYSNMERTEYWKLIFHPGSVGNSFNEFEVGKYASELSCITLRRDGSIKSNKGIKLGMTMKEVIAVLGQNYKTSNGGSELQYTYNVLEEGSSVFMSHYNMQLYLGIYRFREGHLEWFKFGFEYP